MKNEMTSTPNSFPIESSTINMVQNETFYENEMKPNTFYIECVFENARNLLALNASENNNKNLDTEKLNAAEKVLELNITNILITAEGSESFINLSDILDVNCEGFSAQDRPYLLPWWQQLFWTVAFGSMLIFAIGGNALVMWIIVGEYSSICSRLRL